ncbi:MAG: metal ABC transporter ATP-binding protein [Dermatophilus congolensis]|nr:metal ABC transporter ATP-binding protein [Dermatophilus congolensis]
MTGGRQQVVELREACFGYGDEEIVHGVDLSITAGERVGLLGPNGCGKTTLVRGLLGLNTHLSGQVEVFGEPLASLSRRYRLGYVPQRHTLSTSVVATVNEIVAAGRLPHQGWLARMSQRDKAVVAESLDLVGLGRFAKAQVAHLSGGQQRRVLIARALAAQPEVLIMDEPTAGVDATSQGALVDVLLRLADAGVTQLIVTHEVAVLAPLLTRVVAMDSGRIAFDGAPAAYREHVLATSEWAEHHHGHSPEKPERRSVAGLDEAIPDGGRHHD